eukprot:gene7555-15488_t
MYKSKRVIGEDEDRLDNILHGGDEDDNDGELVNGATRTLTMGPRVALKFLVSNNLAGALIGKGGASVSALQSETGARVKISLAVDVYPGTQERVVLVTGAESTVIYASSLIVDRASEIFNHIKIEQTRADGTITIKILVPAAACGLLIGRAGAHIKVLSEESGARVRLNPKQEAVHTVERVMIITGTPDDCSKCISLVLGKLLEDATVGTYQNMTTSYSRMMNLAQSMGGVGGMPMPTGEAMSAPTTIQMEVPDTLIGNILGKKGSTIAEIQSLSGAKVTVSPRGELVEGTSNRLVIISGPFNCAQMAQFFVNNKLKVGAARTNHRGEDREDPFFLLYMP